MNDTTSAAPSAECRAEFEAWAKSHDLAYKSSDPAAMWTWAAWQAAWNRRAQPVAREPMEADVSAVNGINARIHFRRGWRAAEAAHGIGIKKGDSHA